MKKRQGPPLRRKRRARRRNYHHRAVKEVSLVDPGSYSWKDDNSI
jgi:hypothetical protein